MPGWGGWWSHSAHLSLLLPFPVWSPCSRPLLPLCPGLLQLIWTLLSGAKCPLNYSPPRGEVIILWLDQDAPLLRNLQWLPSAFSMVFKVLRDQTWLSFQLCLLPLFFRHLGSARWNQTLPTIFSLYLWKLKFFKHKWLQISFMDPSIFPWENITLSFPKSFFAWHLSATFNDNYFIILCEHIEGKAMLIHLCFMHTFYHSFLFGELN